MWLDFPDPFPPSTNSRLPARPAGGRAVTGVGHKFVGKRKTHLSRFQKTREGGSREEETLPPWCSFLHFSQEKWRPPAGTSPGRCAPRRVKAWTTRRVRPTGGRAPGPTWQGTPCDGPARTTYRHQPPTNTATFVDNSPVFRKNVPKNTVNRSTFPHLPRKSPHAGRR